jgi:hypothetical protein
MMLADVTALVAICAAVVATGGLAWQVYSWTQEHATRITVKATWGFLTSGPNISDAVAMVSVYNRSGHPVEVYGVGWVLNDDRSISMHIIVTPGPQESWRSLAEPGARATPEPALPCVFSDRHSSCWMPHVLRRGRGHGLDGTPKLPLRSRAHASSAHNTRITSPKYPEVLRGTPVNSK